MVAGYPQLSRYYRWCLLTERTFSTFRGTLHYIQTCALHGHGPGGDGLDPGGASTARRTLDEAGPAQGGSEGQTDAGDCAGPQVRFDGLGKVGRVDGIGLPAPVRLEDLTGCLIPGGLVGEET